MSVNSILLDGKVKSYDGNGSYEVEYEYKASTGKPKRSMVTVLVTGKLKERLENFIYHDTVIRVVGTIARDKNGNIAINAKHVEKRHYVAHLD